MDVTPTEQFHGLRNYKTLTATLKGKPDHFSLTTLIIHTTLESNSAASVIVARVKQNSSLSLLLYSTAKTHKNKNV